MPIWLRNFTFSKMKEFFEKEAADYKKAQSNGKGTSTVIDTDGMVQTPSFMEKGNASKPAYSTKRAKNQIF